MKKLLSILLMLFCVRGVVAATPTDAKNATYNPNMTSSNSATTYKVRLPNLTGSGNAVACYFNYSGATTTATVADDKSDTYTSMVKHTTFDNNDLEIFVALNVTSGAQAITATFSALTAGIRGGCKEYFNIATSSAKDVTCDNEGSSTSPSCGSMTTTVDNDLIFHVVIEYGTDNPIGDWTAAASPWSGLLLDKYSDQFVQAQVQTTHGAITPAATMGTNQEWVTAAVALKSASAGTAPAAGIRVNTVYHGMITSSTATGFKVQFPSSGNLLVGAWIGGPTVTVTSFSSDSNSNSWTISSATENVGNGSGVVQFCYAVNATTSSTENFLVNFSNSNTNSTLFMYDISGAATSPFDNLQHSTGTTSNSSDFNAVTITPSTSNGLLLSAIGVNLSSIKGASGPTGVIFDSTIPSTIPGSGALDEDNGWAHAYNSGTSAATFTWQQTATVGAWASQAIAFEAPATGFTPVPGKRSKYDRVDGLL